MHQVRHSSPSHEPTPDTNDILTVANISNMHSNKNNYREKGDKTRLAGKSKIFHSLSEDQLSLRAHRLSLPAETEKANPRVRSITRLPASPGSEPALYRQKARDNAQALAPPAGR